MVFGRVEKSIVALEVIVPNGSSFDARLQCVEVYRGSLHGTDGLVEPKLVGRILGRVSNILGAATGRSYSRTHDGTDGRDQSAASRNGGNRIVQDAGSTKISHASMVTFARTTDLDAIKRLLTIPECWRRMVNDSAPPREQFEVTPSDIEYIIATEDGNVAALFLLVPPLPEVHICVLPHWWGHSREIVLAFLEWVWTNTPHRRLVGPIPAYNLLCRRLAEDVGFAQFDIERGAVEKRGKRYDRLLLEIVHPSPGSNARPSR